jgi:hypothetical protein
MSIRLESIGAIGAATIGAVGAILESPIALMVAIIVAVGVTVYRIGDPERLKLRRDKGNFIAPPVAEAPKHEIAMFK